MQSLEAVERGQRSTEESSESICCEFCGAEFDSLEISTTRKERGKFCSQVCQRRASRKRIAARLALPNSKRFSKTLRYSSPLYFN
ncbi:MAG: hypothetical protein ACYCPW_00290 [Nitrososphaerales archaeon]